MFSEEDAKSAFLSLPPDVLFTLLSYCDVKTLGRLCAVCRRLRAIISQDCIWILRSKRAIASNQLSDIIQKRSCYLLSAKEKCQTSVNWRKGKYKEVALFLHPTQYMPWLQLTGNSLWYSKGSRIFKFARFRNGIISRFPALNLKGHIDDVCRFVCKDGLIVSGGRDGMICGWQEESGQFLYCHRRCHSSDINSIDVWKNFIVSGSRDKTVKIWMQQNGSLTCCHTLQILDRIWSVAIPPTGRTLLCGSAGYRSIPPLQLFDIETGKQISTLGNDYRNGAGVLHIQPESAFELLSCGYDTCIRLWDTRCGTKCILQWEDPHDSSVYCVSSDHNITILSGTSRHGLVRLWDKRTTHSIQMYYVGRGNSPVYSLSFDPQHMYVALDRSLSLLTFSSYIASSGTPIYTHTWQLDD